MVGVEGVGTEARFLCCRDPPLCDSPSVPLLPWVCAWSVLTRNVEGTCHLVKSLRKELGAFLESLGE